MNGIDQMIKEKATNGKTAILPVKKGDYFYVCRHVTAEERNATPPKYAENIKLVMVVNTRFSDLEKCAKEMVRLCRTKGYVIYEPTIAEKSEFEDRETNTIK